MLNDEKIINLISDYNDSPITYDCIAYAQIDGGVKGIHPQLVGDAVFIEGNTASKVEDAICKAADVVGKVGSILGGVLGDVADGLDTAAGEMTHDGAALTITDDSLFLYVFDKLGTRIVSRVSIPLAKIGRVKKSKMLLWHTIRLFFQNGGEMKLSITSKVVGIKNQNENLSRLLSLLDK